MRAGPYGQAHTGRPVWGFDPDGYISYGVNILCGIISKIKIRQSSAKYYTNSIFKTLKSIFNENGVYYIK